MRIAVIGAGAMGSIYGGHLSQHNDVLLVDTNEKVVEQVANNGLLIDEDGTTHTYHPGAVSNTQGQEPVDLVIPFCKGSVLQSSIRRKPWSDRTKYPSDDVTEWCRTRRSVKRIR